MDNAENYNKVTKSSNWWLLSSVSLGKRMTKIKRIKIYTQGKDNVDN